MHFLFKASKILLLVCLAVFIVTFLIQKQYRSVNKIQPAVLEMPLQVEMQDQTEIKFIRDEYEYVLTPLFNYQISGFVVHKMDYRWFSIHKSDSVFPLDLCLIWGDNVQKRVYKSKQLRFSQDMRFCFWQYYGDNIYLNAAGISNNHLLVRNDTLFHEINSVRAGDQVEIRGKLVNVQARNMGKPGEYDPSYFEMHSSTVREDTSAGACEIIYVEDFKILQRGHPRAWYTYRASFYALIGLVILNILLFILEMLQLGRKGNKYAPSQ